MKAVVFEPDRGLQLIQTDAPVPNADEVVVDVEACGVCGSDRQVVRGESVPTGTTFPLILGHEVAGVVSQVGRDVSSWRLGERVIIHPFLPCNTCSACQHGQPNLCIRQGCIGFTRSGGFAEKISVPSSQLVKCPQSVTATSAALLVDAYATPFRAFVTANMVPSSTVLVIGTGGLGLAALQLARSFDAGRVGAVTRREMGRQVASDFGADVVVLATDDKRTVGRTLRRWSGASGIDIVVDTVGDAGSVALGLEVVRPGGTVVVVGMTEDEMAIPLSKSVRRGVRLIGSYGSVKSDVETLVEWTRIDRLDPMALVAETITLEQVESAFSTNRQSGRFVIVPQARDN